MRRLSFNRYDFKSQFQQKTDPIVLSFNRVMRVNENSHYKRNAFMNNHSTNSVKEEEEDICNAPLHRTKQAKACRWNGTP